MATERVIRTWLVFAAVSLALCQGRKHFGKSHFQCYIT